MTFKEVIARIEEGKKYSLLTEDWEIDVHTTVEGTCVELFEDGAAFIIKKDGRLEEPYYAEIYEGELEKVYKGPAPEYL